MVYNPRNIDGNGLITNIKVNNGVILLWHYTSRKYEYIERGCYFTEVKSDNASVASEATGVPENLILWRAEIKVTANDFYNYVRVGEVRGRYCGVTEYILNRNVHGEDIDWFQLNV